MVYRGTPTTCAKCHTQIADAMAGKIGSLVMKADPHDGRVACIECHVPEVRAPAMAQYATQCERCHGVRYRDLLFEWQKSLDDHEQSARLRLRQQGVADPLTAEPWSRRLAEARAAGIHNAQQAIEALDRIGRSSP